MKKKITLGLLKEKQDRVQAGVDKPFDLYDTACKALVVRVGKTSCTFYAYLSRRDRQKIYSSSAHDLSNADVASLRTKADALGKKYEKIEVKIYDSSKVRRYLEEVYKLIISTKQYKTILGFPDDILDKQINVLRADDIEQWKRKKIDEGTSQKTLKTNYYALRAMLEYAKREDHISQHHLHGVKFIVDDEGTIAKKMKPDQLERLFTVLNACTLRDKVITLFTLMCGARTGETLKLKRKDLDFDQGLAFVAAPNVKTSIGRYLEMPQTVQDLLKEYLNSDEYIDNPRGFLFYNPRYKAPIKTFNKPWITIRKAARLEGLRFYDLRHTYCSTLIENAPLHVVQKLMGHKSIKTTAKYLHHFDEDRSKAVSKIDEIFGQKKKAS